MFIYSKIEIKLEMKPIETNEISRKFKLKSLKLKPNLSNFTGWKSRPDPIFKSAEVRVQIYMGH